MSVGVLRYRHMKLVPRETLAMQLCDTKPDAREAQTVRRLRENSKPLLVSTKTLNNAGF